MNTTTLSDVLTRNQTAEYLHICLTTLDRLNLPKIKVRRRVLFSRTAVDLWLQGHTMNKEVPHD